jgi:hypothetical protein
MGAQSQSDLVSQGRVFQSSDDTVFVYKEDNKFQIELLNLTDDEIAGIPDGSPIRRVEQ